MSWLDEHCVLSSRCFAGLSCLHLDFCEWMIARNEVPCTRTMFEAFLAELSFLFAEVDGTSLVSGLILRTDFEIAFQRAGGEAEEAMSKRKGIWTPVQQQPC